MRNRIYKTFSGHRNHQKKRDEIREFIQAGSCVVCGQTIKRKVGRTGRLEEWRKFLNRKTCGMIDGKKSDCLRKYITGEGNPKWRGGLPKCVVCKEQINHYPARNRKDRASEIGKFCANCWLKIVKNPVEKRNIIKDKLLTTAT